MWDRAGNAAVDRSRLSACLDCCSRFRDRLLGDARFRRWAATFPLTRWIARRQARRLFDLCAGFVYSQVLTACVELGVIDTLAAAPRTPQELAPMLKLSVAATERLLVAAEGLQLLEQRAHGRYGLGMLGAALLDNPGVIAMVKHHRTLYQDLSDPVALLRGETAKPGLSSYWPYVEGSEPRLTESAVTPYTNLMAQSQAMIATEILQACDFTGYSTVLDVGGGDGTLLRALASRYPHLQLRLFDLPAVIGLAEQRTREAGLSARMQTFGGDFRSQSLPGGADLITLVRVVHDHDDVTALGLLRAIREALPASGKILIAEPLADTAGAESVGAAYFGMYLWAMGSGRARSRAEICALLQQAGFTDAHEVPTTLPILTRIILATPSAVNNH